MPKKRAHALEVMEGFGTGSPLLEWALLNGGRGQNYAVRIGLLLIRRAIIFSYLLARRVRVLLSV